MRVHGAVVGVLGRRDIVPITAANFAAQADAREQCVAGRTVVLIEVLFGGGGTAHRVPSLDLRDVVAVVIDTGYFDLVTCGIDVRLEHSR